MIDIYKIKVTTALLGIVCSLAACSSAPLVQQVDSTLSISRTSSKDKPICTEWESIDPVCGENYHTGETLVRTSFITWSSFYKSPVDEFWWSVNDTGRSYTSCVYNVSTGDGGQYVAQGETYDGWVDCPR